MDFLSSLCLGLVIFSLFLYQKNLKRQRFWQECGVPTLDPLPLIGQIEFLSLFSKSYFEIVDKIYKKARGLKYCCIFQLSSPTVMFLDTQLIGRILTKDFNYFCERFDLSYNENHAISQQLFSAHGTEWKELSKQVSPVVSPGRINFLIKEMGRIEAEVDIDSLTSKSVVNVDCFALKLNEEIVGEATMGVSFKCLTEKSLQVLKKVKNITDPSVFNFLKFYTPLVFPMCSFLSLHKIKDKSLCDFVKNIIPFRKQFERHRNDVFQFFVDSQTKCRKGTYASSINCEEIIPGDFEKLKNLQGTMLLNVTRRVFWFMVDSQGTNTIALSFVLHLISLHPECQEEIRQELEQTLKERGEHEITYQVVKDLKFTHRVIKECLRLYTPMSVLHRVCTKDYRIPDTSTTIPQGTKIIIPIYSIQRDARYFPHPFKFEPNRFDDLTKITPYTFMPFGEGPRFCIGYRFAMAHLKFTVASLVLKFHIEAVSTDQTILNLHPLSPSLLRTKEKMFIRLKRRDG